MAVVVRAIHQHDLSSVGEFLNEQLNPRMSADAWAAAAVPPWPVDAPNHGYLLADGDRVVGVYLAFYSVRDVNGRAERFCNLAAWCVADAYRFHSVKLLQALLRQPGYTFTDLSPSGSVVALNERLKFRFLDTETVLVPALPRPSIPGRVRILTGAKLEARLTGEQARIHADHRHAAASQHVLLTRGAQSCYVVYRRDRRKGLPLFASVLYVSDPAFFRRVSGIFGRRLLFRHGAVGMLAELRVIGTRPRMSMRLARSRPKMVKSASLRPDQIDNLYSELTCVSW